MDQVHWWKSHKSKGNKSLFKEQGIFLERNRGSWSTRENPINSLQDRFTDQFTEKIFLNKFSDYMCMCIHIYVWNCVYVCTYTCMSNSNDVLVNIFFLNKCVIFMSFLSLSQRGGRNSKEERGGEGPQPIINSHFFPMNRQLWSLHNLSHGNVIIKLV